MPVQYNHDHENEITLFAETNFRNERRKFGIKTDDRRRHMYIIGKTGMGKTTLLENLVVADFYAGHGCAYIDPHGDTAEKLIDYIPTSRINDVVYFNPADVDFPMGFNILETEADWQKPLVASGLMGVFKKIWPDVWSARMEYILMNCVLALLDYPGATLLGINRLLVDKDYRSRVIAKIRDPIVKTFWVAEFTSWSEKYATEAIAPVQNKVGQFLSSSVIRNIVAQVKSTINVRRIMDDGKILIVNLSKGRIGEDNMRLLGGMLITKIQLAAQERQNILEADRRDFFMFVDEFQNFANESFANILSEARKYRLSIVVAHQYIEQLDEKVAPAIFGNVGTIIAMRVGGADAEFMETEFAPTFLPEDLVNLAKTQIYLKLSVDGVATQPFSANTLAPIAKRTGNNDKIIAVSRERYSEPRAIIEEKVLKWSGMELGIPTGSGEATGLADLGSSEAADEGRGERVASPIPTEEAPSEPAPMPKILLQYPEIKTEEERAQETASSVEMEPPQAAAEYLMIRPERMAAIQASIPQMQKKKEKPKYAHTCTRCGKVWHLAIQLDPTRPMYCPECRPIVLEERKSVGSQVRAVRRVSLPDEGTMEVAEMSEGSLAPTNQAALAPNRPRIVFDEPPKGTIKIVKEEEPKKEGMLEELMRTSARPIQTDKKELERRAGTGKRSEAPKTPPAPTTRTRSREAPRPPRLPTSRPPSPPSVVSSEDLDVGTPISLDVPPSVKPPSTPQKIAPGQRVTFGGDGSS